MANEENRPGAGLLESLKEHAGWAYAIGILMIIVGVLSLVSPLVTGLAVTLAVGALLIVSGVSQCVLAFRAGAFGRGVLIFLFGVVTLIAGVYLVMQPLAGLASITLFLAAYFLVSGILAIVAAFHLRPAPNWGWMLANGVVTLLLGVLIWRQWPVSGAWAVGILFGVQLISSGAALTAIAGAVRRTVRDALA